MKTKTMEFIKRMKEQTIGVEIEMAEITRNQAIKVVAKHFGTTGTIERLNDHYDSWSCKDTKGRTWKVSKDVSIHASTELKKAELITPILKYDDMEDLQEIVRKLRKEKAISNPDHGCGVHIHIGAGDHTAKTLRNLCNLMASHEDLLIGALNLSRYRVDRYCKTVDPDFLKRINKKKPTTMQELSDIWYIGNSWDRNAHYNHSRYRMLNLHATFIKGTVEFRLFQFDNPEGDKKGGISLSEGAKKAEIEQLIFITNSPNPLGEDASRNLFCGLSRRPFSSLPDSSQKIITNYLKNEIKLDTSKFTIQVLPFETDDDKEKYKMVMQEINDFIGDIGISTPGIGKKLHEAWRISVFSNGTKKDETIDLTKKDFIWPIIVFETDIGKIDEHIIEEIDEAVLEEIIHRYKEIIDVCCERFEFVTRVLSDYNQFESFKSASGRCWEFAVTKWTKYAEEFRVDLIDDETLENLTKIVLYYIVKRRLVINSIKQGVGL